ncbi:PAS domain S-box protein [Cyanobacteria bacterium FACHB-63]|nr:PAS domain S-box protein [Cyanobacteria bacterium FACHB-63]
MTELKAGGSNHASSQGDLEAVSLSKSEEQFRFALEASPDGFVILRSVRDAVGTIVDFNIEYINPAAAKITNSISEELLDQSLLQRSPNCKSSGIFDRYVAVAETGDCQTFEAFYESNDLTGWFRNVVVKLNDGIVISFSDITERKRVEEEHKQAEAALQRYQLLSEHSRDIVLYLAKDGQILEANRAAEQAYGYARTELLSLKITDLRASHTLPVLAQQFEQAEREGILFETTHQCKDGSQFPVEVSAQSAVIDGERVVLSVIRDITERKRSETALRQSEERLRLAMAGAQMGTWDVDLITGKAIWSEQHFTMLGFEPVATGEATEAMWGSRIHPDDLEQVIQEWQQARQEHRFYRSEYRVIRADNGQVSWLAALGSFTYDPTGQAVRSIGVLFDITNRKQIEMALAAQEQRYRYIFESVGVSIWEEDFSDVKAAIDQLKLEGVQDFRQYFINHPEFVRQAVEMIHVRDVNQASLQLFGAQTKSDLLKSLHQIFTPGTQEVFIEELLAIATEVTYFATETVLQTLQGKQVHVWFSIIFPAPSETYNQVLVSILDITDRKQAEKALQESEERARLAIQVGRLGGWQHHLDTNFVEIDDRMREIWGEPDDAVMLPLSRIMERIHPDEQARVASAVNAALDPTSAGAYEIDYRIVWDDGTERWVTANGQVFFAGEGESRQPIRFFGTALDITDRKQAEEVLRQSEEQFRRLANAMPQIVWTADAQGKVNYVSQQWFDYAGLTLEQTQDPGQYFQVIHPDDASAHYEQWVEASESGSLYQTEMRIRRASDGAYRWFLTRAVPVKTEQGQIIAWYGTSTDIDDRKQTEAALQESEQRLQLAQQAGRIGAWEWNLLTNEVSWSDGIWPLLALESNSITPNLEAFTRFIHPDDRATAFQRVEAVLTQGDDYSDEFRVIRQDGIIRWLLSKGRVIRSEDGQPLRMVGINVDITDRKQAEEALRNSAERLSVALAAAKLGNWSWSAATDIVTFSEQAAELFGIPSGPYMTWTQMQNLLHPEDRERARLQVEQAIAERSDYDIEYRVIHSDQTQRWIAAKGRAQYDSFGQVLGMLGVVQDVTARKQAEAEREQLLSREQSANQTLQRFIEHTPVAVAMLDQNMRYLFASQRWMQEYAPNYTDIRGLSHYEVIPDVPERWRQVHQRCLAGATESRQEDYYPREDGSAIWLHWEILPWYVRGGEIGGIVIFAENITERKQAAQEREELLAREQAARREAEQANRIKDEFLAVLSHELRSPLNPILGWSTLLLNNKLDVAKTTQALTIIQRNAKLQSELIEDLLDVSRILQGKLNLNVAPVNLAISIREAMETVRLAAEAKSIQVKASLAEDVGLVLGDATRLQQIVWNLLSNAVKFTPSGGQVNVQLEHVDSSAQITVSDTGQGITPDFLPYVFDYFRQADGATTRKFGGLGLGLAIVRHLVELHGGTVRADSLGEGQGATFTIQLPLLHTPLQADQDERSPQQSLDLNGIKILIVDDEPDTRDLVAFVLEQQGAQVTAATSAHEALLMLPQVKPDVLLSDIGMPEMDGYMLIQQVRALTPDQGGLIPAIALTAYAGDTNQQQVLAAGFQKHTSKPIEPDLLVQAIMSLIRAT